MNPTALFVLPEVPYPATKNGIAIRYYPTIRELSASLTIDLICWTREEKSDTGDLREYVRSLAVVPVRPEPLPLWRKWRGLCSAVLPMGVPYRRWDYSAPWIADEVSRLANGPYDALLWAQFGLPFELTLDRIDAKRKALDHVDSTSLMITRDPKQQGLLHPAKLAKTRRWEARANARVDAGIYISPVDRAQVADRCDRPEKLHVVPNGIYLDSYTTDVVPSPSPSIGFLGNMGYAPNIDSVHTLHRIFRRAKQHVPDLHLTVIGRDPDPSIEAYRADDVTVTGPVDNVWPYINGVDLFVLPMRMGAGQQNKVLEIMYTGKPVIASTVANGGICAVHGESIVVSDDETETMEHIIELLNDPERMKRIGESGRQFVRSRYGWEATAHALRDILVGPPPGGGAGRR